MRCLPCIAAVAAGLALAGCVYVERERPPPRPVVVEPAPATVVPPPPPPITVRPGY